MGSDNTPKFEVKNTKSRKRTKKKYNSEDPANEASKNTDTSEYDSNPVKEVNEQNMKHKKRKEKKQKSNNTNDNRTETIKNDEEENDCTGHEENQNEEESGDEAIAPPKKRTNSANMGNNSDNAEETNKSNAKTPKQPSKRQLKKAKAEKRENVKKLANKMDAIKKGLNYVSKWKHARSEWKFEKLRQIWLIDNLLDETSIPDDIFPTVLEYFEGCKGMAREQLLKKGMDVVRKVEENEETKEEEVESVAYQRARKLLQALPTET